MDVVRCENLIREAYAYINQGNYSSAINCFDEVLPYGEIPAILLDKGFCLNELNRFNEAIRCFDRVIDIENNKHSELYIKAWFNKGRSFIGLEQNEQAKACFELVLDLDPNFENARIALNLF